MLANYSHNGVKFNHFATSILFSFHIPDFINSRFYLREQITTTRKKPTFTKFLESSAVKNNTAMRDVAYWLHSYKYHVANFIRK